jgi:hypothetical protein
MTDSSGLVSAGGERDLAAARAADIILLRQLKPGTDC